MNSILLEIGWTDDIMYGNLETVETARCYFIKHTPETLCRTTAYKAQHICCRRLVALSGQNGHQQTSKISTRAIDNTFKQTGYSCCMGS